MATHYVPMDSRCWRGQQDAVCGQSVPLSQHSMTPTCPTCRAFLAQQADDDDATAAALEQEFTEYKDRLVTR